MKGQLGKCQSTPPFISLIWHERTPKARFSHNSHKNWQLPTWILKYNWFTWDEIRLYEGTRNTVCGSCCPTPEESSALLLSNGFSWNLGQEQWAKNSRARIPIYTTEWWSLKNKSTTRRTSKARVSNYHLCHKDGLSMAYSTARSKEL